MGDLDVRPMHSAEKDAATLGIRETSLNIRVKHCHHIREKVNQKTTFFGSPIRHLPQAGHLSAFNTSQSGVASS